MIFPWGGTGKDGLAPGPMQTQIIRRLAQINHTDVWGRPCVSVAQLQLFSQLAYITNALNFFLRDLRALRGEIVFCLKIEMYAMVGRKNGRKPWFVI